MFERFDGSGRAPRPIQSQVLQWLSDNWNKSKILAINAPTGVGKSAILRAIQLQFGSAVGIVPSNILLDQYRETYNDLNYVKGAEHYECSVASGISCGDQKLLGNTPCDNCPYVSCRQQAIAGEPTIFNPISYYYLTKMKGYEPPEVLVIDEAHKLTELVMLLTGCSFRKGQYGYPKITTEVQLVDWLEKVTETLATKEKALKQQGNSKDALQYSRQAEKLRYTLQSLRAAPQDFVFYTQEQPYRGRMEEYLVIAPVSPPRWILDTILQAKKVILLSATLLEADLWDLIGTIPYKYADLDSPIPIQNRTVQYRPNNVPMNYETEPIAVANWLKQIMGHHGDVNTIVHLSYGWVEKLKQYFPHALTNTPENKVKTLQKFKKTGGLWLASGCAEGIDLPGDECRLNIIPFIMYSNPTDPVVKKQLALPQGWLKYELRALKTLIQQSGRSTRGIDDYSTVIIGDSRFPKLVNRNSKYLPQSFRNAIKWRLP